MPIACSISSTIGCPVRNLSRPSAGERRLTTLRQTTLDSLQPLDGDRWCYYCGPELGGFHEATAAVYRHCPGARRDGFGVPSGRSGRSGWRAAAGRLRTLALRRRATSRRRAPCRPSSTATPTRPPAGAIPAPSSPTSPHNQCGQKGPALDLALGVTKGRDDVVDRGARLGHQVARRRRDGRPRRPRRTSTSAKRARRARSADRRLQRRRALRHRRLRRSPDRNGNGVADPEDLILDPAYNNGVDDDHNGYVDDISGWDFLYGDNDPLDTVQLRPRHRRSRGLDRGRRTAPATSAPARSAGSCPCASATRSSPTAGASRPACCSRSTRAPT